MDLFAMTNLCYSNSEVRRLVTQGGVSGTSKKVNDIKIAVDTYFVGEKLLLKAGKSGTSG